MAGYQYPTHIRREELADALLRLREQGVIATQRTPDEAAEQVFDVVEYQRKKKRGEPV